ncbi:MAG TPA: hypothetical protein VHD90_25945 [Phototrophicaceae bacterium]|nr:hypothetical protein [Phototrophicaceae bacterium]
MRERAFTTAVIWVALVVCIDRMVAGLAEITTGFGQAGLGFLMFVLILAAMGGTLAIWTSVSDKSEQKQEQSEKAKRSEREARIKRLMATMDDNELDALEDARHTVGDDGERQSLEELLRKR